MSSHSFIYSKAAPEWAVTPSREEAYPTDVGEEKVPFLPNIAVNPDYSKEQPSVETAKVFVISGGEKREPNYFNMLKKGNGIKRLIMAISTKKGQGLNPSQIVRRATQFLDEGMFPISDSDKCEISSSDTIYLVQDVDEYEKQLKSYLQPTKKIARTEWIISNPCFEIWLYYHKFAAPSPQLDEGRSLSPGERSKWLKRKLNELVPGGVDSEKAFAEIDTAIENSEKNYREEFEGFPALYATRMHILAQRVRELAGDEFPEMLERKRRETQEYLKSI